MNLENVIQSLEMMSQGMAGIFAVLRGIALVVAVHVAIMSFCIVR